MEYSAIMMLKFSVWSPQSDKCHQCYYVQQLPPVIFKKSSASYVSYFSTSHFLAMLVAWLQGSNDGLPVSWSTTSVQTETSQ